MYFHLRNFKDRISQLSCCWHCNFVQSNFLVVKFSSAILSPILTVLMMLCDEFLSSAVSLFKKEQQMERYYHHGLVIVLYLIPFIRRLKV